MTEHNKDTTTLNTLIATLLDSVDGYEKSAEDVDNPRYAELFRARAAERRQVVTQLQQAVSACGGNPEDDGTLLGGAHRAFVSLKEAVSARDDKAIINEVERGEDYLKDKFETALKNVDLSSQARAAADAAWTSVKAGHDEMSALKHATV
ncbi:PA2169 family four-helix-bundle protein [Novosphingobium tardum]|uniref:PA2169 family four-helix-bundle protein n=1 Tax=Novosphingobium tardum TaxID=1538021 RepID=A0ABV8RLB8_9SPHN